MYDMIKQRECLGRQQEKKVYEDKEINGVFKEMKGPLK